MNYVPYRRPQGIRIPWVPLWGLTWFYLGARLGIPLLFRDSLYWVSVANVLIGAGLASLSILAYLIHPFRIKSVTGFWAFIYIGWVTIVTVVSPYRTAENNPRILGLLVLTTSIVLVLLLETRKLHPERALILASRWYIWGLLLSTLLLLASGAVAGGTRRFGDVEVLHPNVIGFAYGVALLQLLFLPVYRSRLVRVGLTIGIAILFISSFSKTAIIGMVLSLSIAGLIIRGWRKAVFYVGLLSASGLILFVLYDFVVQQVDRYAARPEMVETLTGRTLLWEWVLDMVRLRPTIGYGWPIMQDVVEPFMRSFGFTGNLHQAHNAYLDVLFVAGSIGLIAFSVLILGSGQRILTTIRHLRGEMPAAFLASAAMFILVRSMTEGSLNLRTDFLVLLTLAFVAERIVKLKIADPPSSQALPRSGGAGAADEGILGQESHSSDVRFGAQI